VFEWGALQIPRSSVPDIGKLGTRDRGRHQHGRPSTSTLHFPTEPIGWRTEGNHPTRRGMKPVAFDGRLNDASLFDRHEAGGVPTIVPQSTIR
jgi:hypothetical protein